MKKRKKLIILIAVPVVIFLALFAFAYRIYSRVPRLDFPMLSIRYDDPISGGHIRMTFDDIHRSNAYKNADDEEKKEIDLNLAKLLTERSTDTYVRDDELIDPDSIILSDEELRFSSFDGDEYSIKYPNSYGIGLHDLSIQWSKE